MKIFSIQSNIIAGIILLFFSCQSPKEQVSGYYQPWVELEELFVDVQMSGVFEDSKLFVDCTPLNSPQAILASYREQKGSKDFDLESFVLLNFSLPVLPDNSDYMVTADLEDHLNSHWDYLTRNSQVQDGRSTLITLPETYVVPGGRFREIYYWDSYFTMIGLVSSGRTDLLISMLDNFAFLIDTIGFIPNGNRTYYLGRSQPPFFAAMVNILIQSSGREEGLRYLPAIEKEYRFWMEGSDQVSKTNPSSRRVVYYDGTVLN